MMGADDRQEPTTVAQYRNPAYRYRANIVRTRIVKNRRIQQQQRLSPWLYGNPVYASGPSKGLSPQATLHLSARSLLRVSPLHACGFSRFQLIVPTHALQQEFYASALELGQYDTDNPKSNAPTNEISLLLISPFGYWSKSWKGGIATSVLQTNFDKRT